MQDEWDRKPKDPPSVWLKLKSQGEVATIRIAAAPLREVNVWPAEQGGKPLDSNIVDNFTSGQWMSIMRSPDWEIREAYILLVIDRSDNNAKIFRVSGSLYGKIRDYAQNPKWGSPAGYDLDITRTEIPGKSYWEVTPDPNKSNLLVGEVDKIKALDLGKLVPNALPTNVPQPDEIDEMVRPEPLPWERPATQPQKAGAAVATAHEEPPYEDPAPAPGDEDAVIEDIGDEPINLDDIHFN